VKYLLVFLFSINLVCAGINVVSENTGPGTAYTDASDLSDQDLANQLNENPSTASGYSIADLTRAIEADSSLAENTEVMKEFDKQVVYNKDILNKNFRARRAWFNYNKINIAGSCPKVTDIKNTPTSNGRLVKLDGKNGVTFNIDLPQFKGATIQEDGSIELASGTTVSHGSVDGLPGKSNLRFRGCIVDVSKSKTNTYGRIYNGIIKSGDEVYIAEYETMHFTKFGDKLGIDATAFTRKDNSGKSAHSGRFNFHNDGHMSTEGITSYTKLGGKPEKSQYSVSATNAVDYYSDKDKCSEIKSCVVIKDNTITAKAKGNNNLGIKNQEFTFDTIHLTEIDDTSTISIHNKEDVAITYTSDPADIHIKGMPSKLPKSEIKFDTEINGEKHCHTIKDGTVLICTVCKEIGSFSSYKPSGEANSVANNMYDAAKKIADDPTIGADWSAKGKIIYADENNPLYPTDEDKMSVEEYQKEVIKSDKKEAYDCIGLVQKACMMGTGDGYPWYTLTSSAKISERLVQTQNHQAVYAIVGSQAELDMGILRIPDDVKKIPGIQIKLYASREQRLNDIENIPAGSAVSNYLLSGEESHTLIKGAHRDEIAAHIFENEIYETKSGLSFYREPMLLTYPKTQTVKLSDILDS